MRTLQLQALQSRANDDGTLTLEGIAVPYNETIEYLGQRESFAPGAFDPQGVIGRPLLHSHDRSEQIGHVTEADNTPDGLRVVAVVQPTAKGKDVQMLLRSKALRGLSVGFGPIAWRTGDDGSVTHTKADFLELSTTPLNAYPSAEVTATRSKPDEGNAMDTTEALAGITSRLDQIESRMTAPAPIPARALQVREALALQLAESAKGRQLRALADVVSSGNSGVLPQEWSRDVRNTLDGMRYFIPHLGTVPFPSVGYSLAMPKVVNHTTVAARGAEKTEIPSSALTTGQDFYNATWYAGGVDIALELLWQSDPSILAIVVDDMLRQYAAVTDQAATAAFETGANSTPSGAPLNTTNYGAFVADVVTKGEAIRVATGTFGDLLSLTTATWVKVLGFTDESGRRILASGGATNSDGSAQLSAATVDIAGITAFHNPRATVDLQFNTVSARIAERPPTQVQSDNVALMGRDVGILGAIMDLPVYPAGIIRYSATTAAAATKK